MAADFLLYGANGFVGEVISRLAVQRGLKPILAGRNAARIQALAAELGLPCRVFDLKNSTAIDKALKEVAAVLHCAGPYAYTSEPMANGCLRMGTHYLDLTGEIAVYEALAHRDNEAKARKVMLLPGVGFDVVPTDCLALHLKERLPSATHLRLAWRVEGPTKLPPGTLNTALVGLSSAKPGVLVRRNGQLEYIPPKSRMIDFGDGPLNATLSTWGDVFTSFYSTGIPNMEEYIARGEGQRGQLIKLRKLRPLLRFAAVRKYVMSKVPTGPTVEERAKTRTLVWGEVEDGEGHSAVSRLKGPEPGVTWTSLTALAAIQQVLAGNAPPGFQTPALAYGADFGIKSEAVALYDVD